MYFVATWKPFAEETISSLLYAGLKHIVFYELSKVSYSFILLKVHVVKRPNSFWIWDKSFSFSKVLDFQNSVFGENNSLKLKMSKQAI